MKQSVKILIGAFAAIGVVSTGALLSTSAVAQEGKKETKAKSGTMTAPMAKVTPVQAMKSAEGKVGGKAMMALFEYDEGHWTYGVVVVKNHKLMEVDVDPLTGKAGATEDVTPEDEAQEFKAALAKMIK